ncbi:MAG: hypothetical protein U0359_21910 [Byssovorax sp.]
MSKKPRRGEAAPPYARLAFLNPYNISLLIAALVVAAATGHWWIALCALAAEAIWMLFAPDSTVLQKLWFDKALARAAEATKQEIQEEKLKTLDPMDQSRALYLREQKARIFQLAKENPSLTVDMMKEELAKLDDLLDDFISLAMESARAERHLASFDLRAMEASWNVYRGQVQQMPEGDKRRAVAKKNMEVLEQRRKRWDDLKKSAQTARGQMELMENTFKLLADEIVTMSTPAALGARLEDLRIGVEAIREAAAGDEAAYEEEALEEAAEERRRM